MAGSMYELPGLADICVCNWPAGSPRPLAAIAALPGAGATSTGTAALGLGVRMWHDWEVLQVRHRLKSGRC